MTNNETPVLDASTETTLAPVWKNLIFLKDGRTLFGFHSFPSAAEAAAAHPLADKLFRGYLSISNDYRIIDCSGRHLYYVRDYSHAIPMPVPAA